MCGKASWSYMVRKALGMCIVDKREVRSIACIEIQSVRELAKQK